MANTPRTFDQTCRLAKHLGDRIKAIEESKMPWSTSIGGKGKSLLAIHDAMSAVAQTPNGSINEAALRAFDKHVDVAIEGIRAWAKELFTPEESNRELLDDEIDF